MTQFLLRHFVRQDADAQQQRIQIGNLSSRVGILVNVLLAAAKILIGWFSGTISILGDGLNNLFDTASALISLVSFRISAKPADEDHPFGHARFEYIASGVVGLLVFYAGITLLLESVKKWINPEPVQLTVVMIVVLLLSIAVKIWLYFFYRTLGRKADSELILANAADSLSDILATAAILIALLLSHFFGWKLDGPMGVFVALIILKTGYEVLKSTVGHLLGRAPVREDVQEMKRKLLSYPGVLGIHDLVMHEYGPFIRFVTVHVEVDAKVDVMDSHELIDRIEREMEAEHDLQITIHMDPLLVDDPRTEEAKETVTEILAQMNPKYDFHDFRIVESGEKLNLFFDVVLPVDEKRDENAIRREICQRIQKVHPEYTPVIVMDRDFTEAIEP